jgi:hypothetical protein
VSFSKLHITRIVNLSVGMRAILMQLYWHYSVLCFWNQYL